MLHWHLFSCWYAYDNSTGNLDHARKASMWVSGRTYCCAFCAPTSLLGSIRECSMDSPWYPSESARWTPTGIHQRMLDGHQWPHSLILCCGNLNTLFCTLAGTPLTLIFLPGCPPLWLHDQVVSAPGLPSPRCMTAGASVCRSGTGDDKLSSSTTNTLT